MVSEGSDPANPPKQTFELNLFKKNNKATYNTAIRDFFYCEMEATFKKRYFSIISPNI